MIHVFHTPTGWKVCQEYPEKPKYPICKDIIHESNYYPCRPGVAECYCRPYLQAVALSIANAVDVREEDEKLIVQYIHPVKVIANEPDLVYALPELEMKIKEHCQHKGIHNSTCVYRKLAHVFRKKEEPKIEESQEELWLEIESIIDKWWDDKNDLRSSAKMVEQDLASKFHLTRVKAELKGEKK